MAPYPQPGPPHAPPQGGGSGSTILLFVLMGLGAIVMVAVVVGMLAYRTARRPRAVAALPSATSTAELPAITRHVPHHPLSLLDGCTASDLRTVEGGIGDAIDVGAPLYNAGNFAGCYHLYDGAAADVERKLPATCAGPAKALEAGRARAASLPDPGSQAWAMRDAFDGVLEVVERWGVHRAVSRCGAVLRQIKREASAAGAAVREW